MIYRFLLLVMLITVGFPRPLKAEVTTDGAILIITSYNPETRSISDNLSAFMDEYKLRGGKRLIVLYDRKHELQEPVRGTPVERTYGFYP